VQRALVARDGDDPLARAALVDHDLVAIGPYHYAV
jgi:hypothetical protein